MKARNAVTALTLAFAFALSCAALAQTSNSSGLVTATDALGISCGGWSMGNLTTESYDLLDYGATKDNRLFAQGVELTAPGCGLSVFGGGVLMRGCPFDAFLGGADHGGLFDLLAGLFDGRFGGGDFYGVRIGDVGGVVNGLLPTGDG